MLGGSAVIAMTNESINNPLYEEIKKQFRKNRFTMKNMNPDSTDYGQAWNDAMTSALKIVKEVLHE